ncbi:MAG: MurT ligase domain-containing protein [Coriobacteriia bacterium]|nr:MurT ligase domain-containing protein [Coriobacteriia bacterium]
MNFKFEIAKIVASASRFTLKKILRRPGGFYPGKLALQIDKNIISELSDVIDGESVVVTGTNGKTSVTALITACLESERNEVISNRTGANMASGVAAAMLEYKKKNRRAKTYGVFEVDEMWVHKVVPALKAKYFVLLDLFPDQVDRMGSIENIQRRIKEALDASPNTVLIYNADDPNCQIIADNCNNESVSFGMHEIISDDQETSVELCPKCNNNLTYYIHQYAQLGDYKCNKCGFNRAKLDYGAANISLRTNKLKFSVGRTHFKSNNAAEYVTYNLVGYIACTDLLGCKPTTISKIIKKQKNDNGRLQYFKINGKKVMINLAKNPAGFNQNIKYMLSNIGKEKSSCAFFVNTKEGDGHDSNWLYDVYFSRLKNADSLKVFYGGDASERLESILNDNKLQPIHVENAQDVLNNSQNCENVYIIANYTAMFPLRDELMKMEK